MTSSAPEMTPDRINEILGQLNEYEARDWDSSYSQFAIWRDVIEKLPEYDAAATSRFEYEGNRLPGYLVSFAFIAGDLLFAYSMEDGEWFTEAA